MRMIDADKIEYEPMLSARGNGQYEDVMVAYKDQIDMMSTIEERNTGRAVYKAGYADGYNSAQLERKTGKWIQDPKSKRYRCDQCLSFALKTDDMQENLSDFCPVCGAMMKGKQP